jgi:hypothetical protein
MLGNRELEKRHINLWRQQSLGVLPAARARLDTMRAAGCRTAAVPGVAAALRSARLTWINSSRVPALMISLRGAIVVF